MLTKEDKYKSEFITLINLSTIENHSIDDTNYGNILEPLDDIIKSKWLRSGVAMGY